MSRRWAALAVVLSLLGVAARAEGAAPRFAAGKLPQKATVLSYEPGIDADPSGTVWIASTAYDRSQEIGPLEIGGASLFWRSTNGGRTYKAMAGPLDAPGGRSVPLAGSDTDIAVARERNPLGNYNVYAAMFWDTPVGSNIALTFTPDSGTTWATVPVNAPTNYVDRPWVAADGPCTVYLGYLAAVYEFLVTNTLVSADWYVNRINVCGTPSVGPAQSINSTFMYTLAGKLVVDRSPTSPYRHTLYFPLEGCPPGNVNLDAPAPECKHSSVIYVAVSRDGGATWRDARVTTVAGGVLPIWNTQVAVDASGRVYATWFDDRDAYIASSTNAGRTWTKPVRLNPEPSTAIYPFLAGGRRGVVEAAWYGTRRDGNSNSDRDMGRPGKVGSAEWRVMWARSTDGGKTFTRAVASAPVHLGAECTHGFFCDAAKDYQHRISLFENLGMVIDPRSGKAAIAYTTDRPSGTVLNDATGYATQR